MEITLIGAGMGGSGQLTLEGARALEEAQAVIGAPRLLEGLNCLCPTYPAVQAGEIAARIRDLDCQRVCVVFSGDVGFYSGARSLHPLLEGHKVKVVPGISSVQYLAARLCRPWQGIYLVSGHGVDCDPAAEVSAHRETFFLTGGSCTPSSICAALTQCGMGAVHITVGERLSYPDERITSGTACELAQGSFAPLSVVLADNPDAKLPALSLPDSAFVRSESIPMTKAEVRSAILGKLRLRPGECAWDVGAGTGSVSVEMARAAAPGAVFAVERREEGFRLMEENRRRLGAWNLRCTLGHAPQALEDLPAPDAVFVGGSGGALEEIAALALSKNHRVRLVISAITLETLSRAAALMAECGMDNVEIVQISVSRVRQAGKHHMLSGQNPVFLISGEGTHG